MNFNFPHRKIYTVLCSIFLGFFFVLSLPFINAFLKNNSDIKEQKQPKKIVLQSTTSLTKKKKTKKVRLRKKQIVKQNTTPNNTARNNRLQLDFNALNVSGANGSGVAVGGGSFGDLIFDEGDLDILPIRLLGEDPELPDIVINSGISGLVKIEVVIDEFGKVVSAKRYSEDPEGYGLANVCINAILNWTFKPGEKNNVPVKSRVIKPFRI